MGSNSSKTENNKFGSYKDPNNPRPGYFIRKVSRKPKEVYYKGKLLEGVDIETFVKLGKGRAIDKNGFFYKGKRVNN